MEKKDLLNEPVRHIDIKSFDSSKIIEAMVYAEAGSVLPLIVSDAYHQRDWESRIQRQWAKIFE